MLKGFYRTNILIHNQCNFYIFIFFNKPQDNHLALFGCQAVYGLSDAFLLKLFMDFCFRISLSICNVFR